MWPFSTEFPEDFVESTYSDNDCTVHMGRKKSLFAMRQSPSILKYICNHCRAASYDIPPPFLTRNAEDRSRN
jgi:hypothetical protein